jgi:hypothetical protein
MSGRVAVSLIGVAVFCDRVAVSVVVLLRRVHVVVMASPCRWCCGCRGVMGHADAALTRLAQEHFGDAADIPKACLLPFVSVQAEEVVKRRYSAGAHVKQCEHRLQQDEGRYVSRVRMQLSFPLSA